MIERPVRDLHSSKQVQPLFCKVIVDGDKVTLESKGKDDKKQTISWKDMVYQVEASIEDASKPPSKSQKLPQIVP